MVLFMSSVFVWNNKFRVISLFSFCLPGVNNDFIVSFLLAVVLGCLLVCVFIINN